MATGGKVRTRFAPSPTGYMHVGGLRTALYAYLIAKKDGGTFILRIEDTDRARYVEGAVDVIIKTLRDAGLHYDEGPGIGGKAGPYVQSERIDIYRPHAEELCKKGKAYYCFCDSSRGDKSTLVSSRNNGSIPPSPSHSEGGHATIGVTSGVLRGNEFPCGQIEKDPCRDLPYDESKQRADAGQPHVIRMKAPQEGETTVTDEVFGTVTVQNKTLDDMVLLKRDGMPTYNFANVVDDHLMEITHVLRGSEYISSAPKYNLLYQAFGWEIPVYITVSPIMRDAQHKLSKRDGDPTYDDLIGQGYLPEAVLNYVALLGWSPGGDQEFFTLDELIGAFDISGISKAPAIFDIVKLNYFNSGYIRKMTPEKFAEIAGPYIKEATGDAAADAAEIAQLLQTRCEKLSDIPGKIDFIGSLPDYDLELFVHQKSKTDKEISLSMLKAALPALEALPEWTTGSIHDTLISLAGELNVKNAALMWPVRIAAAGKAVTPGGAVEICKILGRGETLRRIGLAISRLEDSK